MYRRILYLLCMERHDLDDEFYKKASTGFWGLVFRTNSRNNHTFPLSPIFRKYTTI